jgi:LmbE family N-acetylglucosaminyl deacetylase
MSARISGPFEIGATYQHIYLSPHSDDAALSCGGAIARHVAAGRRVLVVTICAAAPSAGALFNALAQENHQSWGVSGAEAMARRLQEDVMAMELLGADYLWLDFLDAMYRMPEHYVDDPTLFGAIAPYDPLAVRLAATLAAMHDRCPGATLYAPLGVGNHVDHQATYMAAEALALLGRSVAFYEDAPYAFRPGAVAGRLAALSGAERGGGFLPSLIDIDRTLARKISAVDAYASQIGRLFGGSEAMVAAVTAYAESLRPEQGTYGERLWLRVQAEG